MLTGRQIFDQIFIPELHKDFLNKVPIARQFEAYLKSKKATIHIDHGATRTLDDAIHHHITRICKAFGMSENKTYYFEKDNLSVTDLQFNEPNSYSFKWFSARLHIKNFPKAMQATIQERLLKTRHFLKRIDLLEKLESDHSLNEEEAIAFCQDILYHFLKRPEEPMNEAFVKTIDACSKEAINSLLIGPEFNHLAYLTNKMNIQDDIEMLNKNAIEAGIQLYPNILGTKEDPVRQTASASEIVEFKLENSTIKRPAYFIELIERHAINGAIYESLFIPNIKQIYSTTN